MCIRDSLITLIEIAMEEQDDSSYEEIQSLYQALAAYYEEQKLLTLLSGEYDGKNAILTFHAGAGGTESQDWVQMLLRMYTRWAERHGFKVKILDIDVYKRQLFYRKPKGDLPTRVHGQNDPP